ncbi:hypothetical protein [Nostoc edaphicum]|nr:hypothetical protein [Nostoc edaphicum]
MLIEEELRSQNSAVRIKTRRSNTRYRFAIEYSLSATPTEKRATR